MHRKQFGVRWDEAIYRQFEALAKKRNEPVADILKESSEFYLKNIDPKTNRLRQQLVGYISPLFQTEHDISQPDDVLFSEADASGLMVWVCDSENRSVYASPCLAAYTGMTATEFLGGGWLKAIHPEDQDRVFDKCTQSHADRVPYENTYRLRRADGNWGWMIDKAHPRKRDGTYIGYIGTLHQSSVQPRTVKHKAVRSDFPITRMRAMRPATKRRTINVTPDYPDFDIAADDNGAAAFLAECKTNAELNYLTEFRDWLKKQF